MKAKKQVKFLQGSMTCKWFKASSVFIVLEKN